MGAKWDILEAPTDDPQQELLLEGEVQIPIKSDRVFEGMNAQQAWHLNWLAEAFRVLKPGGVIKSFGGARTFHRLVAAMEQAGFKGIHIDAWVYGCLSEDTEILTKQGWVQYHKSMTGTEILGFDPQKNSITVSNDLSWQKVQEVYDYPYDDTAYHIIGDFTDHIVSKQHRCVLRENDEWVIVQSDDLPPTGSFPYLELIGSGIRGGWGNAKIESIQYTGTVWCVKVPTGAFVARRNGKVFITGNSGFPKSLNISKALDKKMGRLKHPITVIKNALAQVFQASGKTKKQIDKECGFRASNYLSTAADDKKADPWFNVLPSQEKWKTMKQVLGVTESSQDTQLDEYFASAEREILGMREVGKGCAFTSDGPKQLPITLPESDISKKFDGYGTALKPAFEPVIVGRKPE